LVKEEAVEQFPTLVELQETGDCRFLEPIHCDLALRREGDLIRLEGRVATRVALICSCCLTEFAADIDSPFTIIYSRQSGQLKDEEVELGEEDLISVDYSGDEIDLAPELAEQVALEIPLKPLCREGCLGLCSVCGADLNAGECGCDRREVNLKFGALKDLKIS
jgi:uncharacterized protein